MESYDIGLGNNDATVRSEAERDYVRFWDGQARLLNWFEPWTQTLRWDPPFARWFVGGVTNISYNALDAHQDTRGDKPAILWEGEDGSSRILTYRDMWLQVQRAANGLKSLGVKKGDRVTIYLPMVPELIISMMACARIGAVHTVVFSGFSAGSLAERINDSGSEVVIAADVGYRRGRPVRLMDVVGDALIKAPSVRHVVMLNRESAPPGGPPYVSWDDIMKQPDSCAAEPVGSTDPLFILYTSGTTGRPKGVLHGTGGYMTHIHSTFRWAFDIKDDDIYFCTADIGWVTGHSYVAYAPFLCGATQVIYEGAPDYPDASRLWKIIEKYRATIFYTTPTALRMLIKHGDHIPKSHDLSALRLLGSVGEPINPEVWKWYYRVVGGSRCPIIDTWWQTETGGMLISALPGIETRPLKPGSGTVSIPGLDMAVLDENGNDVPPDTKGYLAVRNPWPGMMLTLWKDDQKYKDVYWSKFDGCYYPGDYARIDEDGYLWLLGRADDILKVSGHRIGTAELESCVVSHDAIAESAVVGMPDEVKGESIVVFAVPREGAGDTGSLGGEIRKLVVGAIGPIAKPDSVYVVPSLPKTRSGKIMRRLLKNMVAGDAVGDTTTMEDASVLDGVRAAISDQHG